MSSIQIEHRESTTYLTLNRPEVFNSFNQEMALSMQKALHACASEDVRCVVIQGNGKAFCAGQDLGEITDPEGPELKKIVSEHYNPIIRQITELEKPVIAAVNGIAAGAGANIALACDVVIAKESAAFMQAFSKIGLIPDSGGTWLLPRIIGFQKALALTMLAEKVSAAEAERMGMIYKSTPDEDFDHFVENTANKLAGLPTKGLAYTKKAYHLAMGNSLSDQLDVEEQYQFKASQTHDYNEGVDAFMNKRKPSFKGK